MAPDCAPVTPADLRDVPGRASHDSHLSSNPTEHRHRRLFPHSIHLGGLDRAVRGYLHAFHAADRHEEVDE